VNSLWKATWTRKLLNGVTLSLLPSSWFQLFKERITQSSELISIPVDKIYFRKLTHSLNKWVLFKSLDLKSQTRSVSHLYQTLFSLRSRYLIWALQLSWNLCVAWYPRKTTHAVTQFHFPGTLLSFLVSCLFDCLRTFCIWVDFQSKSVQGWINLNYTNQENRSPPYIKDLLSNQLLIILFARLYNLFCSFQKSAVLHLGNAPLLMLHLFYGTRCH